MNTEARTPAKVFIAGYSDCWEFVAHEAFSTREKLDAFVEENNQSRKNKRRGYGWVFLAECVVDEETA